VFLEGKRNMASRVLSRTLSTELRQRVPAHVPEHLVVAFNAEAVSPDCDPHVEWKRIQDTAPPVFWTPYGEHWVVTNAPDIKTVQIDYQRFSHSPFTHELLGGNKPISLDPPDHTPLRKMFMPAFLPRALDALEDKARAMTIQLAETLKPRGECEFVEDFAKIVPMEVFLLMVGLPSSDRKMLTEWVGCALHERWTAPEKARDAMISLRGYIYDELDRRRATPTDDLLTMLVTKEVEGQRLSRDDAMSVAANLLLGGLDTVAAMLSFIARSLATHPDIRHRIVAEPKIIHRAIDELLRRHALITTFRRVVHHTELNGVELHAGDLIQVAGAMYGFDDTLIERPLDIDLDRKQPVPHAVFGNGPHICPGQMLARRELKVFLEEWLSRIPNFEIKPGTKPEMTFQGTILSVSRLELCWDSGT
jgi:cytochrome P450